jgi:phosphonate transport system substrate-binding protein
MIPFILCILFLPGLSIAKQNNVIKFGVASMMTPIMSVEYYRDLINYIGDQIHYPVEMVYRKSYQEMDTLLRDNKVQVAFICSGPYVKDHADFGLNLLVVPVIHGKITYRSYIIVNKDNPISSFKELKGKTFAFEDPMSNTGTLYPLYLITKMGYAPETFFQKYIYTYSHNKSIELVAKKLIDSAAVDSLVYDYMVRKGLPYTRYTKIIQRSPPLGIPPVVITKGIDPVLKDKIKEAFLNIGNTEAGRKILYEMGIDRFVQAPENIYNKIITMEKTVYSNSFSLPVKKEKHTIYFGLLPEDNPRILYEEYKPLMDYLSEKTGYHFKLVLKKGYRDTVKGFENGTIDMALLGPLTYLEAHTMYDVKCILRPKGMNKDGTYRSVIIVRKDSPITVLSELKGTTFAFADYKSTAGNLIPRIMLAKAGIHLMDLKSYTNFDYYYSVLRAVLSGQFEAGAMKDTIAYRYLRGGIKIIAESEPIPTGCIVVSSHISPDVAEKIKSALLALNNYNLSNEKFLRKLDELKNGFIITSDKDYQGIKKEFNDIPQTCGMGCHPRIQF